MKIYVITLAKTFPVRHPKAGEDTYFRWGVENRYKIHTIRCNVPLWQKRVKEVEAGKACLSLREWSGKPYNSMQVEIARLTKEDGIGMQILRNKSIQINDGKTYADVITPDIGDSVLDASIIARNDGLSLDDWLAWFKGCKDDYLAIIHFTPFRY